jgi:polyhydroxyalkanoate synthesis regulator protein
MGGYLEKGAKAVIDMQEELRTQALKLFSGFPYPNAAPPAEEARGEAKPAKAAKPAAAKKSRTRK